LAFDVWPNCRGLRFVGLRKSEDQSQVGGRYCKTTGKEDSLTFLGGGRLSGRLTERSDGGKVVTGRAGGGIAATVTCETRDSLPGGVGAGGGLGTTMARLTEAT
jgi:hypothetical protein